MDANALKPWLTAPPNTPTQGIQHPLQLGGSTAMATLGPVQNQTAHIMAGKLYLPSPTPYLAPINHERIATHQAPHTQDPADLTPDVSSAYLLPVTPPGKVQ